MRAKAHTISNTKCYLFIGLIIAEEKILERKQEEQSCFCAFEQSQMLEMFAKCCRSIRREHYFESFRSPFFRKSFVSVSKNV